MADVSGAADVTTQQATIHNRSTTNAGAEREQEDVCNSFGCAEPGFGEKRCLAIVKDRDSSLKTEPFLPIEIFETMQARGHGGNGTAIARRQAGGGDAD